MSRPGELQQHIEDMALRLVVGDPDAGPEVGLWLSALEQIHASAVIEQSVAIASAAKGLIRAVRECGNEKASVAQLQAELQTGIASLQQEVERPSQASSSAPCPASSAASSAASPAAFPIEWSPAQDEELVSDFIMESREHLANMEALLLTLERNPHDSEALNAVFRSFHTIKGLAGFLELPEIQKVAHEVETVLDRARNSEWIVTGVAIDVILFSADYLNRWLAHLESVLNKQPSVPPALDSSLMASIAALVCEPVCEPACEPNSKVDEPQPADGLTAIATAIEVAETAEPPKFPLPAAPVPNSPALPGANRSETIAVKVNTAKLDHLVDMAGEMVIAESRMRNDPDFGKSPRLQRKVAHLTRITAELQKTAIAMRLVPIGPLFGRMARLVRDLSRQFGKQVEMVTEGDEIDLDRTIVEELADPLMHMVRNALDHGIERPAEREAQGKNPTARLLLRAQHRAGQVVIEIADDGRGLNRDAIMTKAIQRGVIQHGANLTDSEIYSLIFEAGFTTAAEVTNVSGRGVGMDVVRRHIDTLRGRIEIQSKPGVGASFILRLPLTLAIIDGLVVGVGEERYIIPLFSVRELFRPTPETMWTVKLRAEMALVRGSLMPVLRLHRLFQVRARTENPLEAVFVVAEVEGQRFCVMVDELIGKQEVVIKALGETFKNISSVVGGAILGDGRVGLILDLDSLFKERQIEPVI